MKKIKMLLCAILIGITSLATPVAAAENTIQDENISTISYTNYASGMVESYNSSYVSDSMYCSSNISSPKVRIDFSLPNGETTIFKLKDPHGNYVIFNNGLSYIVGTNGDTQIHTIPRSISGYYTLQMQTTTLQVSRVTVNIYK